MQEDVKDAVGKAMGRIPSGLFIISVAHDGRREGMLGSWLTQAGFEPPSITFAVGKDRSIKELLDGSKKCVINVIGQDDGKLMGPFFKAPEPGQDSFSDLATEECAAAGGSPILSDCLAWMACEVRGELDAGDHMVIHAEVVDGKLLKGGDPKTHIRESGFKY